MGIRARRGGGLVTPCLSVCDECLESYQESIFLGGTSVIVNEVRQKNDPPAA